MGGNYEKSIYNQLMEVMEKLSAIESEHIQDRKEIKALTTEVTALRKENVQLKKEVVTLKAKNAALEEKNAKLEAENKLLHADNERMKRILNNDSSNSSNPPSKDQPGKAANTYNGRRSTKKKAGAQPGHKGRGLTQADVEQKIQEGIYEHRITYIGTPSKKYITRYNLDLEVNIIATEIRIYANDARKFEVPSALNANVTYGSTIQAMIAYLYSDGVVANDRICGFINALSGDQLSLSTGSTYAICQRFARACTSACANIEQELLNAHEICTDATPMKTNGQQTYIRNFSIDSCVRYTSSEKKDLDTLSDFKILREFAGIFTHDHETALYHFGSGHGECNVHLKRYLQKNSEETKNNWSQTMSSFLEGMNQARKRQQLLGYTCFTSQQLERYSSRYDEILANGLEENKHTKGRVAKQEEKALLNRLKKYKENHLLFLYDFKIHYSNNMSERDLRMCKSRQKMAGGFRSSAGREMYCNIMSVIGTLKRRGLDIFQGITGLLNGTPVIL